MESLDLVDFELGSVIGQSLTISKTKRYLELALAQYALKLLQDEGLCPLDARFSPLKYSSGTGFQPEDSAQISNRNTSCLIVPEITGWLLSEQIF